MSSQWKKELRATSCPSDSNGGKYATIIAGIATAILLASWGQLNLRMNDLDGRMRALELATAKISANLGIENGLSKALQAKPGPKAGSAAAGETQSRGSDTP